MPRFGNRRAGSRKEARLGGVTSHDQTLAKSGGRGEAVERRKIATIDLVDARCTAIVLSAEPGPRKIRANDIWATLLSRARVSSSTRVYDDSMYKRSAGRSRHASCQRLTFLDLGPRHTDRSRHRFDGAQLT